MFNLLLQFGFFKGVALSLTIRHSNPNGVGKLDDFICLDPKKIVWSGGLKSQLVKYVVLEHKNDKILESSYNGTMN